MERNREAAESSGPVKFLLLDWEFISMRIRLDDLSEISNGIRSVRLLTQPTDSGSS